MSKPGASHRIHACIAVIVLLGVSAQVQRFLQSYKDESQGTVQAGTANTNSSGVRKEFVGDFQVYYTAALVARQPTERQLYYPQNGEQILAENVPEDTPWGRIAKSAGFSNTMAFIYPPFAALMLSPLSVLKWQAALLIWRVVLVGVVLVAVYLCVSLTSPEHRLLKFGLAASAALAFFPLTETLMEGQFDPFILLFWVAGIYLFEKGHSVESAFVFALGTAAKLSPAIVVGLFLLRRRWTWLASYAASLLGLFAVSVWRLGWSNHVIFFKQILPQLSCGAATLANRSLPGLIYDIYLRRVPLQVVPLPGGWVCTLVKAVGLIVYLASLFILWRRNRSRRLPVIEFMPLALLSLLVSPVSWRHHYLLALLPLIFMWSYEIERRFDLAVLLVATLSIGTVLPDYVITAVRNPAVDLLLVSLTPISTLLLLWVACVRQSAAALADAGANSIASSARSF